MNTRIGTLAATLSLVLAGCVHPAPRAAAPAPAQDLLVLDTHVDIPLDYMRDPRYDVGGDSALQVDLGKMERGGLDAAFFVIYVGQGPLTPDGYADAVAQAERKYSSIQLMLDKYPDRIRLATTPTQVRGNHAAVVADRAQQVVGQVARHVHERTRGGMRTDDRRPRQLQHVADAVVRCVRDVHHHSQRIGARDHRTAELADAGVPGAVERRFAEFRVRVRARAQVVVADMGHAHVTRAARVTWA